MAVFDALGQMVDRVVGSAKSTAARVAAVLDDQQTRKKDYQPSPDEVRVLRLLEEPKRTRMATLQSFEPIWTKCILYTAGIQHLRQLVISDMWTPKKVEDWIPLPVINYIQPKVMRAIDFFAGESPTCTVDPKTRSEQDVAAAELAEAVREYLWQRLDEDEQLDEAAAWYVTVGNVFKKTYIDTTLRARMKLPRMIEMPEPLLDENQQPIVNPMTGQVVMSKRYTEERDPLTGSVIFDEIPQGDVASEVVSPLSMTVPMAARHLHKAAWVMQTDLYPVETLRQLFPDKADYIHDAGRIVTSDLYVHRIMSILTSGFHGVVRTLEPFLMHGYGLVNHYERAPDPDYPNGLLVIEYDNMPLFVGDLPLGNRFSFEHAGYNRVPGRFWFRGLVEDLLHPQDQINKLEQYLQLNDDFNINGQWVVPEESNIAKGSIKNKPGQVIRYAYPYKPEKVPGMAMPPQVIQRRAMYSQDMEELSNIRNVLVGQNPPQVTAGVALEALAEDASSAFRPAANRFKRFIERVETSKLSLVQKFYTEPRYLAIRGDEGSVTEIQDFVGTDLRGNVNVRIQMGSPRARSRAARKQLFLDALDKGLFPNLLNDPAQYEEALMLLGLDEFGAVQGLDYKRAKWENEMMQRSVGGPDVARMAGDDDLIHLACHTAFRKTKAWLRLPNVVQQRFIVHEMEHLLAIIGKDANKEPHQINEDEEGGEGPGAEPAGEQGATGEPSESPAQENEEPSDA